MKFKGLLFLISILILSSSLYAKKMNILVDTFTYKGMSKHSWISAGLTDTVISDLNKFSGVTVITEQDRKKAIKEMKLSQYGFISEETAVKVGKMTGANILFRGSYQVRGNHIRVHARLIKVVNGSVMKSIKIDGTLNNIFKLQDKVVIKLMKETKKIYIAGIEPVKIEQNELKRISKKYKPRALAYEWYSKGLQAQDINPRKALRYYKRAVDISPHYFNALNRLGWLYGDLSKYNMALFYYKKAHKVLVSRNEKNTSDYASLMNNLGCVYKKKSNYGAALGYFYKSKMIRERLGLQDTRGYGTVMFNIGQVYSYKNRYDTALKYYLMDKRILDRLGRQNTRGYAYLLNDIGLLYRSKRQYRKALNYYKQAKRIQAYLGLANTNGYAVLLNNIGSIYKNIKQYRRALKYYMKSKMIRDRLGYQNTSGYAILMYNIGNLYYRKLYKPCKGAYYLRIVVRIDKKIGHKDYASDKRYLNKMIRACRNR